MNEEAIKHAFDLFVRDGYNGDINKFQKLLATNSRALEYSFKLFEKDGYKDGPEKYKLLMGLNQVPYAPQDNPIQSESAPATTEPAKTEPTTTAATTTPAKTEPAKPTVTVATETAPAKTEPAKELSNKQSEAIKVRSIPQREVEMPVADTNKMPPMTVKEAEPEVKEEPKKELPIGENLLPVTEKTEVKAVETPSDKMVIKSEKKEEAVKVEEPKMAGTDVIEGKGLFVSEDLKGIKLPKYKPEEIIDKKLLTENKEALGLKQFEDRDLIFKKWLESKGMPLNTKEESLNSEDRSEYNKYQYNQESNLTRAIVDSYLPYLMENKDKLSDEYKEKLREELTSPTFKVFVQGFRGDFYNYDKNNPNFKLIEKVNEEYWRDPAIYSHVKSQYGIQDGEKQKVNANEFLQSPILNNSEKVITKFGPMFYDKENDTYYKYEYGILNAEPYIKYQLRQNPDYQAPLEVIKPGTEQHKLIKEGNKETWDGVDRTMYRGASVKKDGTMQVKEVTEQPKVEVKAEEPKMVIKSEKKVEEAPKFKDKSDYVNLDFKKEYDFEKDKVYDSNHVERKNFKDKQVLRLGTVRKKDGDKRNDLSIGYDKSKNKWFSYDFRKSGKEYDTWEEVKSDKLISFLNNEFKDVTENKQIEAKDFRKLESDYMPDVENKAKIAEFYFKITPEKSIKPFGDKGPTVYFDEKENEYFTKDKEGRNVIEKGSEKYNQIQNKIVDLASKQPVENNLDCPPGSSDCSNKDDFDESYKFFKSKDPFNAFGYYTQKEGNLATHLDEKVKNYNNQEWGGYTDDLKLLFLNRESKKDYKSDDPTIKKYKNKVFYIGETPPTSKRFSIYYLDDSNKSYIYDNETKSIMKELDSRVNLTTGRKKAWESILVESPEYKEARDAIEFIKYKKIKGNRSTSIPTFNPVPETPEWQKQ